MTSSVDMNIVRFCAEECERQHSGEMSVVHMIEAYERAIERKMGSGENFTSEFVRTLGYLVDRTMNGHGYRRVPVFFVTGLGGVEPTLIPQAVSSLVSCAREGSVSAEDFYQEFETIHPFIDGNGRVGAILYNYLCGTLLTPLTPPEYKRGS